MQYGFGHYVRYIPSAGGGVGFTMLYRSPDTLKRNSKLNHRKRAYPDPKPHGDSELLTGEMDHHKSLAHSVSPKPQTQNPKHTPEILNPKPQD